MACNPPIKYIGGKSKLLDKVSPYIPDGTNLIVEPFCGGAALSFSKDMPIVLNDMSHELINFYDALMNDYRRLKRELQLLSGLPHCKETFLKIREMDRAPDFLNNVSKPARAARYYYLVYAGFNGLMRVNRKGQSSTPIGDKPMSPNLNALDAARDHLIANCKLLSSVEFDSDKIFTPMLGKGVVPFVFIDPPYRECWNDYTKDGDRGDFYERLDSYLDKLTSLDIPFLMTNNHCDFITERYSRYSVEKVAVKYTVAANGEKRGEKFEAFVSNQKLIN